MSEEEHSPSKKPSGPKGLNLALNLDAITKTDSNVANVKEKLFEGYDPNPSANRKKQMAEGNLGASTKPKFSLNMGALGGKDTGIGAGDGEEE